MKKIINYALIISLFLTSFFPVMPIKATGSYCVKIAHANGEVSSHKDCHATYEQAKEDVQNYKADDENVPMVVKNNEVLYVEYGTVRLTTLASQTITIFNNKSGTASNFGYFNGAYNSDALFLDYCPTNQRYQIKINGRIGWINANNGEIKPFSNMNIKETLSNKNYIKSLTLLNVRKGPGTSYQQYGCDDETTCFQNGVQTRIGNNYEWLNKGKLIEADGFAWYKIKINNMEGYVAQNNNKTWLEEVKDDKPSQLATYYEVNTFDELRFRTNNDVGNGSHIIGPAPFFLEQGVKYYSFDGIYFYKTFSDLVKDEKQGDHQRAVNSEPYYNYYLYLSHRTKSNYTAAEINDYLSRKYDAKINRDAHFEIDDNGYWVTIDRNFPSRQSMLYDEGGNFKKAEQDYGTNAILSLSVAINESGWGRSFFAVRNYNLFGHAAYDHNPGANASSYSTVGASIKSHATNFIRPYLNPTDSRFFGPHLGTKQAGMNYRYASDAYWGVKAAALYYSFDKANGMKDYGSYLIGIKQTSAFLNVRTEPTSKSDSLYQMKNVGNVPVIILDAVAGEKINDSDKWYKIQTDVNINSERKVERGSGEYNYELSYGYVHSSYIYATEGNPIINANNKKILLDSEFDALEGVKAYSSLDEDLTSEIEIIKNEVNTSKEGKYLVVYQVIDSEGNKTTREITITVFDDNITVPELIAKTSYENDNNYLRNIKLNTTIDEIINNIHSKHEAVTVVIKNSSNNEKTDGVLKTGDKINIKVGSDEKEYEIVILGDVIGDGKIGLRDLLRVRRILLKTATLEGAYLKAADLNGDGKVTLIDLLRIQKHLLDS